MLKTFRKYYLPGIISLVGLPLMLLHYLNKQEKKQFTMEIIMPKSDYKWYKYGRNILYERNQKFARLKQYDDNSNLIDITFQKIKDIEKTKDTLNCYGFTQVDKIYYKDLIYILNQCQIHDLSTYWLMNDTFLIYYSPPLIEPTIKNNRVPCATGEIQHARFMKEQRIKERDERMKAFWLICRNSYLKLLIPFFGMLLFWLILPLIQRKRQQSNP